MSPKGARAGGDGTDGACVDVLVKLYFPCGCIKHIQTAKLQETGQLLTETQSRRVEETGQRPSSTTIGAFLEPNIFGHDDIKRFLVIFAESKRKQRK